jgi:hypothetical protein
MYLSAATAECNINFSNLTTDYDGTLAEDGISQNGTAVVTTNADGTQSVGYKGRVLDLGPQVTFPWGKHGALVFKWNHDMLVENKTRGNSFSGSTSAFRLVTSGLQAAQSFKERSGLGVSAAERSPCRKTSERLRQNCILTACVVTVKFRSPSAVGNMESFAWACP